MAMMIGIQGARAAIAVIPLRKLIWPALSLVKLTIRAGRAS